MTLKHNPINCPAAVSTKHDPFDECINSEVISAMPVYPIPNPSDFFGFNEIKSQRRFFVRLFDFATTAIHGIIFTPARILSAT
jgi:hypothetical protein